MSCLSNSKPLCRDGIQAYFVETGVVSGPCPICRSADHKSWADVYFEKAAVDVRKAAWLETHPPAKPAEKSVPQNARLFDDAHYPG